MVLPFVPSRLVSEDCWSPKKTARQAQEAIGNPEVTLHCILHQ